MTATTDDTRAGAVPWHFWVVVAIAVLWNGFGGVDYTMSHLQPDTWYRQMGMSEAAIAALNAFPSWMHAVWAVGVWGSVVGTILLLVRSRWAFHAFAVSTLGALGSLIYGLVNPVAGMGPEMPALIVAICLFFVWYSWLMTKRAILR